MRTVGFFRHYIELATSFILRSNSPFNDVVCDGVNGTTACSCSLLVNDNSGLVHQCPGEGSYGNLPQPASRCINPR